VCHVIILSLAAGHKEINPHLPTPPKKGEGYPVTVSCLAFWKNEELVTSPTQSGVQGI